MTSAERATFMRLTCRSATYSAATGGHHCSLLIGYSPKAAVDDFGLESVAYGSFTRAGADQAYVTYSTMNEPHAYNFGGGILFDRTGGDWQLVRWYPGGQMDRCVSLPGDGRLRMLCLSGFLQEGELSSTVWVRTLPASGDHRALSDATLVLLSVDDTRNMSSFLRPAAPKCRSQADYKTKVILIDTLQRSTKPGFFAQSAVTYVTPKEAYDACKTRSWAKIDGQKTTVYYALKNAEVKVDSPIAIGMPDE
jgi:hypothetical protein